MQAWVDGVVVAVVPDLLGATVVVVVGSAAAADAVVVVDESALVVGVVWVASATVVSVVPEVWASTEWDGTTVRAAMAPPVTTAEPRAAASAVFLMDATLGLHHWMALGDCSDRAPNPYRHRRARWA